MSARTRCRAPLGLRGALLVASLALPAASSAATPEPGTTPAVSAIQRTSVADVEDEVMCVQCGRPLATSAGSAADQQRQLMQDWIDEGAGKQEVKDRLVAEYGERVLVDDRSPIAAAAPWLAGFAGILSITLLLRHRRQRDVGAAPDAASGAPATATTVSAADDARIDAELADLERS